MFRLTSRRFIQELFQDVQFMPVRPRIRLSEPQQFLFTIKFITSIYTLFQMYEEAEAILKKLPKPVEEDVDPPAES